MFIRLDNVDDRNAYSMICQDDLEAGQIVMVKGLADAALAVQAGVALDGEIFEGIEAVAEQGQRYVLVAPDNHRYEQAVDYNTGDIATIEAGEAFRGYVIRNAQEVTVEKAVIDGELAVGDKVTVKGYKLAAGEGLVVGKVLWVGKLYGKDMVKIMFV